jgi:hypothetical protein
LFSYFTVVTVAVSAAEGVAFTVLSTLTTEVESVFSVAFSVDEPVPHELKDKAKAKVKTVNVFIERGFIFCSQFNYL